MMPLSLPAVGRFYSGWLDRRWGAGRLEPGDDRVRDLAGSHGRRVVTVRLHVVGDLASLPDGFGDRALEHVGGVGLTQMVQHHDARQYHRHRVVLVHPSVL